MRGFPASFVQVVTEHKQTDALPGALHAMADFFEGRSRLQSTFLAATIAPLRHAGSRSGRCAGAGIDHRRGSH